jgi:hypothetical protein
MNGADMKAILLVLLVGASGCAFAQTGVGGGGEPNHGHAPVTNPPHGKPDLIVPTGSRATYDKTRDKQPSAFDRFLRMFDIIDRRRQ